MAFTRDIFGCGNLVFLVLLLLCIPRFIINSSFSKISKSNVPVQHFNDSNTNFSCGHLIHDKCEFVITDKKHKLHYCFIPKNACSTFKRLFYGLIHNTVNKTLLKNESYHNLIKLYNPTLSFFQNTLRQWTSLVVLRDPLERLLSGFLQKCVRKYQPWCEGPKTTNFTEFANRVMTKIKKGRIESINNHFQPQYTYCDMKNNLKHFTIIFYDKLTVGADALKFLQQINLEKFHYGWGRHQNQSLFDLGSDHPTYTNSNSSLIDKIEFYKHYYTKDLANKVLNTFRQDYEMMNVSYPEWVKYL